MELINTGITRHVFLTRRYAIKMPRLNYGWRLFLRGILANIDQARMWRDCIYGEHGSSLRDKLLCPVLWCSWGGWVLIMLRTDVRRHCDEVDQEEFTGKPARCYAAWVNAGFGGDDKCDNYGYLRDKLVKIDYGS